MMTKVIKNNYRGRSGRDGGYKRNIILVDADRQYIIMYFKKMETADNRYAIQEGMTL